MNEVSTLDTEQRIEIPTHLTSIRNDSEIVAL